MSLVEHAARVIRNQEASQGLREFGEVIRLAALHRGDHFRAYSQIKDSGTPMAKAREVLQKTAVGAQTLSSASPLAAARLLIEDFLASLRYVSVFDAMLGDMRSIPLGLWQYSTASSSPSGSTVSESDVKPLLSFAYTSATTTTPKKTSAIIAMTDELLRASGTQIPQQDLAHALGRAMDDAFLAAITSGAPTVPSAGGNNAAAIMADISLALAGLQRDANSKIYLVISPGIASFWMVANNSGQMIFPGFGVTGGTIQNMVVLVSDQVSQEIIAIDARQILAGTGPVEIDTSNQVSLHMDTSPDSPPVASSAYVSLWQLDWRAIKAERWWQASRLRTRAVSVVSVVLYSGDSPAA